MKADRHVDGYQHDRHGDDRVGEVAGRLGRGLDWSHALFQMTIDAFHNDDGVIHDQTDRQDQR